jgi:xanthine dehydrogenase accessory factor
MQIYHKIQDAIDQSEPVALCTIVESHGSTPRHGGSKMLVYPADAPGQFRIFGTVGGGEVESRVIQEALQALKDGKNRLLRYEMVDPRAGDPGVCGGQLEVYVEPILPKPCLVVIGGGHVGKAVAHLAHWLGFRVAVCDDRAEYCTAQENPDADEFYPVAMGELPSHLRITPNTYLVCTSRGAVVDIPGLPPLLDTQAAYIGVIGSRRRWTITRQGLQAAGVSAEKIDRIHSPVGLELNAETPEEIAVSILAEIIQVRNGGTGHSMKI